MSITDKLLKLSRSGTVRITVGLSKPKFTVQAYRQPLKTDPANVLVRNITTRGDTLRTAVDLAYSEYRATVLKDGAR